IFGGEERIFHYPGLKEIRHFHFASDSSVIVAFNLDRTWLSRVCPLALALSLLVGWPSQSAAYAVLAHEAVIDSAWNTNIRPLLLKRFPQATPEELKEAHGYAYGGAIIQDMGYYPHGSKFFSDLTHYVRSGDFVRALLRDSQDLNG